MKAVLQILGVSVLLSGSLVVFADDVPSIQQHGTMEMPDGVPHMSVHTCQSPVRNPTGADPSTPHKDHDALFEGLQIETSNLASYEQFFESVLHAPVIQRMDHPQVDSLRGYCYRGVLVVVRQDFRIPRPTGWVQINFAVSNVAIVQDEVERSVRASTLNERSEEERAKVVRVRLKTDVMRGGRKAIRLEVFGPEGFMIGFDQYK
jgi:hypothetical protein